MIHISISDSLLIADDYVQQVFLDDFGYDIIRTVEFQRLKYIDFPLFLDYVFISPRYNMMCKVLYRYGLFEKIHKTGAKNFYSKFKDVLLIYEIGRNSLPYIGNSIYYSIKGVSEKTNFPSYSDIRQLFFKGKISYEGKDKKIYESLIDFIPEEIEADGEKQISIEDLNKYYVNYSRDGSSFERNHGGKHIYHVLEEWRDVGTINSLPVYVSNALKPYIQKKSDKKKTTATDIALAIVSYLYNNKGNTDRKAAYDNVIEASVGRSLFGLSQLVDMKITLSYMGQNMKGINIVENYVFDEFGRLRLILDDKRLEEKISTYFNDLEIVWRLWGHPTRMYFLLKLKRLMEEYFIKSDKKFRNKKDFLAMFFLDTRETINYFMKRSFELCAEEDQKIESEKYCRIGEELSRILFRDRNKSVLIFSVRKDESSQNKQNIKENKKENLNFDEIEIEKILRESWDLIFNVVLDDGNYKLTLEIIENFINYIDNLFNLTESQWDNLKELYSQKAYEKLQHKLKDANGERKKCLKEVVGEKIKTMLEKTLLYDDEEKSSPKNMLRTLHEYLKDKDDWVFGDLFDILKNESIEQYLAEMDSIISTGIPIDVYKNMLIQEINQGYYCNNIYANVNELPGDKKEQIKTFLDVFRIIFLYKIYEFSSNKGVGLWISRQYPRFYRINEKKWFLATLIYLIGSKMIDRKSGENNDETTKSKNPKEKAFNILWDLFPAVFSILAYPNVTQKLKTVSGISYLPFRSRDAYRFLNKSVFRCILSMIYDSKTTCDKNSKDYQYNKGIKSPEKRIEYLESYFGSNIFAVFGLKSPDEGGVISPQYIHVFSEKREAEKHIFLNVLLAIVIYYWYFAFNQN